MSGVAAWTAAGFPVDQILLGIAAYGHSYFVNNKDALNQTKTHGNELTLLSSYPPFNASASIMGDLWDDAPGVDQCGNPEPQGYVGYHVFFLI